MVPKGLPLLAALLLWASPSLGFPEAPAPGAPPSTPAAEPAGRVIIDEVGSRRKSVAQPLTSRQVFAREPPGSPVKLFTPDGYQFYTLNKNGQLVMKQMTQKEIQGMIAASAGNIGLPVQISEQKTELTDSEPQVSDVVQNVQKVLKGELNKPTPTHNEATSIPDNVNSQWTNMLPYILSGGSLDQENLAEDTSLLGGSSADQNYVNVVSLHSDKPMENSYEPGTNYVQIPPINNQQDIKLFTRKPAQNSHEKPIYLLGNMALDSGILGGQETYTVNKKGKPSRPVTSRPSVEHASAQNSVNSERPTSGKPTLYIPFTVSSPTNQENHNDFELTNVPDYVYKSSNQKLPNVTASFNSGIESTTAAISSKKPSVYIHHKDESGHSKRPTIQLPITSTQKFEILPTVAPGVYVYKKPEINREPSLPYRPVYKPVAKPSTTSRPLTTIKIPSTIAHQILTTGNTSPIKEVVNKPSVYSQEDKVTKYSTNTYQPLLTTQDLYTVNELLKSSTQNSVTEVIKHSGSAEESSKVTVSDELNKSSYSNIKKPDNKIPGSESPALILNLAEKPIPLPELEKVVLDQHVSLKTEKPTLYNYNYPIVHKDTTKESVTAVDRIENTPDEVTETVIPSYVSYEPSVIKESEKINLADTKLDVNNQKNSKPTETQSIQESDLTTQFSTLEEGTTETNLNIKDNIQSTVVIPENILIEIDDTTKVESSTPLSNYSTEHANENNLTIPEKTNKPISIIHSNTKTSEFENSVTEKNEHYQTTFIPESTIKPNKLQTTTAFTNFVTDSDGTSTYDKTETITQNNLFPVDNNKQINSEKEIEKISIAFNKIKIPYEDDELSTIKVIPVYDDDTSIYNLPSENPNKIVSAASTVTNKPSETKTPESLLDTEKPFNINESSISSSITTITPTTVNSDGDNLPGLDEIFNNYMKEHYDQNLPTTGNYEELSHLTTFPAAIPKESLKENFGTTPLMISEYVTYSTSKDQIIEQKSQIDDDSTTILYDYKLINQLHESSSTPTYDFENNKESKTEESLNSFTHGFSSTTEESELKNKSSGETPIIYLDLSNPISNENSSTYELNKDYKNNSSLTRIKITNLISDLETLMSDVPPHTNIPSTESYTLPTGNYEPSNIGSGLIAGYPTYNQLKPTSEKTILDDIKSTPEQIDKENPTILISNENEKLENKNVKPTTSKVTIIPEIKNYESYTQIPFESLPMVNKPSILSQTEGNYDQLNSSFNPPFEKINDLINQLQNSPSDHDTVGYDYSNGVATTIVPLDRFQTIINNLASTDAPFTTILDNLSKTSTESQNKVYFSTQTLMPFTETIQSRTESSIQNSTTKGISTSRITTQHDSKIYSTSKNVTVQATTRQPSTAKPYTTSTFRTTKPSLAFTISTTKGSIEKVQSTIDKSAGRINLEDEKNKLQPVKPTESTKFTVKNKIHYSTIRRPTIDGHTYTRKPTKPLNKGSTVTTVDHTTGKPSLDIKENNPEKWSLNPSKNVPDQSAEIKKVSLNNTESITPATPQIVTLDHATGAIGLDQSNKGLDKDVAEFLDTCNELSFKFWTLATSELSSSRSVTISPFGMISTLAMIFLGARGLTSNQMNDILKLDDVVTFNPHLVFQNITDTVTLARGQGIENAAFVRALFADRLKVRRIIPFYKEQAQQFYEGAVVDINFSTAGDILRRRTNLLIRKQTGGRIKDFMKTQMVPLRSPLTALSANVFQTSYDSPDASSEGRDGEMYFAVSQTVKQRKLVPIPAVVWRSGVSAGYEPSLDATAVALGDPKRPVSLIMVMPGQQGLTAPGDNLERLEHRLFGNPSDKALEKLLKVIVPRRVEVQMPKFSHRSVINVTSALKKMGFDQLFSKTADLKGINGAGHDLFLADMLQMNLFYTYGDEKSGGRHLSETYPGTSRHVRAWAESYNRNNGIYDNLNSENVWSSDFYSDVSSSNINSRSDKSDWSSSEKLVQLNGESEKLNEQISKPRQWYIGDNNDRRHKLKKRSLKGLRPPESNKLRSRRQAEEKPRMKMDKPFLYLIRHNLTGLILHMGRFNPKNNQS